MDDVWWNVGAVLVSAVVAAIVAWLIARRSVRLQERLAIESAIDRFVDVSIQYPFVEDDAFCAKWGKTKIARDDRLRYDNYCCLVFNAMERIWRYHSGNTTKMATILHCNELIKRHSAWWLSERENQVGYAAAFASYVNQTIGA